ncbi:MAG: alanine racemase [Chthoniobacter sp.]|jgi:alanine racemase|nr:alanine racemase [Chthoniobacter sp.]
MIAESSIPSARRCWAEIDLAALRHNAGVARERVGPAVKLMAVVKANAYGHGVGPVAKALADRADMFGVANVAEARELRTYLPAAEVFILGPALPEELAEIVAGGFVPSVSTVAEARALSQLCQAAPVPIHLVVDTGMGRIGVWEDEAVAVAREILQIPGLTITGIASHLPVADEDEPFTSAQLARFHHLAGELRAVGLAAPIVHIENSAGLLGFPAQAGDMVRAGLMLYGSAPLPEWQPRLRPVLTWKARATLVRPFGSGRGVSYGRTFITPKEMRIATLGVGYADGYQRHLTGRGAEVLIGGRRCPVLGRITMDQILVDVTALPAVTAGEEAVLLGRQGGEEILAAELAQKAGTIAWEIFTGIGRRVERVYL